LIVLLQKQKLKAIPEGYTTVTPWIITPDSVKQIEFMEAAFGAKEIPGSRLLDRNGSISHVEVQIGNSIVILFDAGKDWPPTTAFIRVYVESSDDVYQKAIRSGATPVTKLTHLFFGDKVGRVSDPFGDIWWIQEL
jgi:PhnB protein